MRAIALAISSAVLVVTLGTPSLLFAQEAPPDDPAVAAQVPPPDDEAPPADDEAPVIEEEGPAPPVEASSAELESDAVAGSAGSASVTIRDFLFSPGTIQISVGGTVTWSNAGQENHTATGSGFDTGTLGPGGSASQTFATSGTFSYICNLHPDMTGTVRVLADSGTDPGPGGTPDGTTETQGPTGTSVDTSTLAPGSEAAAGLRPNGAGSGRLPATGEPAGALIVLGVGLIGCGLLAGLTARLREREELHLTYR